ncbi:MAG: hypothetical protein V4577_08080 [Bacteroidota bacterium]
MKKHVINLLTAVTVLLIWGCSTKSDPTPTKVTGKFTVNGNAYTEIVSQDSTSSLSGQTYNVLGVSGQSADKSATAQLIIFFPGSGKPKAGAYTVVGDLTKPGSGNICGMIVTDKVSIAKQGLYSTTGLDGTSVVVAVSASGKLTVTMPSIAIKGSNFDNTDPKNTVITDVTGSVSGTAVEN